MSPAPYYTAIGKPEDRFSFPVPAPSMIRLSFYSFYRKKRSSGRAFFVRAKNSAVMTAAESFWLCLI